MTEQDIPLDRQTQAKAILWGLPVSAWTGKVRSYLIKKGIPFEEHYPAEPRFAAKIVPRIGHFVVPVIEMPDGMLLQDSTEAMLYLERTNPQPALIPSTPVQSCVASLINFIGSDGFAKAGMHYRWSYLDHQDDFIESAFMHGASTDLEPAARREDTRRMMRFFAGYCPSLGITADSQPGIEQHWLTCLDLLETHLTKHPYLLGGRPSIGDCGMMTMFFAHLGRDPYPSQIMKTRAQNVYRWTERMFQPGFFDGQFADCAPDYLSDDALPETLMPVLAHLLTDAGPEVTATLDGYVRWLSGNPPFATGAQLIPPDTATTAHPAFGEIEFAQWGTTIKRQGTVDTVFQFQEVRRVIDALPDADRAKVAAVLSGLGGGWVVEAQLGRAIRYDHYNYVAA